MALSFTRSCASCTDNAYRCSAVGVGHHKEPTASGVTDGNEPWLTYRMIGVVKSRGEQVVEDSDGLIERHAMLFKILLRLGAIPFELHVNILARRGIGV